MQGVRRIHQTRTTDAAYSPSKLICAVFPILHGVWPITSPVTPSLLVKQRIRVPYFSNSSSSPHETKSRVALGRMVRLAPKSFKAPSPSSTRTRWPFWASAVAVVRPHMLAPMIRTSKPDCVLLGMWKGLSGRRAAIEGSKII